MIRREKKFRRGALKINVSAACAVPRHKRGRFIEDLLDAMGLYPQITAGQQFPGIYAAKPHALYTYRPYRPPSTQKLSNSGPTTHLLRAITKFPNLGTGEGRTKQNKDSETLDIHMCLLLLGNETPQSVECQRMPPNFILPVAHELIADAGKNWKRHKLVCDHNVAQRTLAGGTEPIMQRNLRHWVSRFDASLLLACIRGLGLNDNWEHIGQGGLVLFLEPRVHANLDTFNGATVIASLVERFFSSSGTTQWVRRAAAPRSGPGGGPEGGSRGGPPRRAKAPRSGPSGERQGGQAKGGGSGGNTVSPQQEIWPETKLPSGGGQGSGGRPLSRRRASHARLQATSDGTSDYAKVVIVACNAGPEPLEGHHPPTMRVTPLDIHQWMVTKLLMEQYDGDWCQDLMDQVHNDHPLKRFVPPQP
ncbi:hypothetical protein B0H19DRAFT_1240582 [Mycena capillaripes]|nr:hypothetical protein B0H19DRAFT_1240582 [Mycena capillaripes]